MTHYDPLTFKRNEYRFGVNCFFNVDTKRLVQLPVMSLDTLVLQGSLALAQCQVTSPKMNMPAAVQTLGALGYLGMNQLIHSKAGSLIFTVLST